MEKKKLPIGIEFFDNFKKDQLSICLQGPDGLGRA